MASLNLKQRIKFAGVTWIKKTNSAFIKNVTLSPKPLYVILWVVVGVLCFSLFVWQFVALYKQYYEYNKNTLIKVASTRGQTFPAVTLCNLNPMSNSAAERITELNQLLTLYKYFLALHANATSSTLNETTPSFNDSDNQSKRKKRDEEFSCITIEVSARVSTSIRFCHSTTLDSTSVHTTTYMTTTTESSTSTAVDETTSTVVETTPTTSADETMTTETTVAVEATTTADAVTTEDGGMTESDTTVSDVSITTMNADLATTIADDVITDGVEDTTIAATKKTTAYASTITTFDDTTTADFHETTVIDSDGSTTSNKNDRTTTNASPYETNTLASDSTLTTKSFDVATMTSDSGNSATTVKKDGTTLTSDSGNIATTVRRDGTTFTSDSGNSATTVARDGTTSTSDSGNSATTVRRDGTTFTSDSGNSATTVARDGTTLTLDSGNSATTVRRDGTTSTSDSGNSATTVRRDGTTFTSDSSNSATTVARDGTTSTSDSGNSATTVRRDGTTLTSDSGNSATTVARDGTTLTLDSGNSATTVRRDGTTFTSDSGNSATTVRRDGTTFTSDSGNSATTVARDGTTSTSDSGNSATTEAREKTTSLDSLSTTSSIDENVTNKGSLTTGSDLNDGDPENSNSVDVTTGSDLNNGDPENSNSADVTTGSDLNNGDPENSNSADFTTDSSNSRDVITANTFSGGTMAATSSSVSSGSKVSNGNDNNKKTIGTTVNSNDDWRTTDMPSFFTTDGVSEKVCNGEIWSDGSCYFHNTNSDDTSATLSTPPEAPVYNGHTQTELDALMNKYNLNPSSSVTVLESQLSSIIQPLIKENSNSSYNLEDLFISCQYNMIPCNFKIDFKLLVSSTFGNCYTFNYDGRYSVEQLGDKYGLQMIAFSNVSEYLPTSSKSGMRVIVHKQNYQPFPESEGVTVGVGTNVNIAVNYNDITRLSKPYGNCHSEIPDEDYIFDSYYAYEGCYQTCFQWKVISTCGCADSRFSKPKNYTTVPWCMITNLTAFVCYENYISSNGSYTMVEGCACLNGCKDASYDLLISNAIFPAKKNSFHNSFCWNYIGNVNMSCYDEFINNAMFINVNMNTNTYTITIEVPDMSLTDVFNKISSAAGLWLGFSFLVLAEFIETLAFIVAPKYVQPVDLDENFANVFKNTPQIDTLDVDNSKYGVYGNKSAGSVPPVPMAATIVTPTTDFLNISNVPVNIGLRNARLKPIVTNTVQPNFCFD